MLSLLNTTSSSVVMARLPYLIYDDDMQWIMHIGLPRQYHRRNRKDNGEV